MLVKFIKEKIVSSNLFMMNKSNWIILKENSKFIMVNMETKQEVYGCQHRIMNPSFPPWEGKWIVIEEALVLRREEFFSLWHADEKKNAFTLQLSQF